MNLMTTLDAGKSRFCFRRKRAGTNRIETNPTCRPDGVSPDRRSGSIPGSSTKEGPQIRLVSRSRTCRRRFQARASLRYIRSWPCHCGSDNPSRTCDAAKVSTRAAKPPVQRRIPAPSGRMSAHRATAPSALRPRRLPRRVAPAIKPQKKPRRKNPRARRLFLRATADAVNPHIAAMMATPRSRAIRCVGPSDPISQPPGRRLRRPLARSNHRLRRTSIAGQYS